ncbi:MAG: putative hydro-lyase [Boseongicola sp. SB0675_bin_26]|nr:putative hydro-lyase [Boseongicola sp. SB0675_bin_26]
MRLFSRWHLEPSRLDQGRESRAVSDFQQFKRLSVRPLGHVRQAIRKGVYCGQTAGLAPGKQQCNVAILPLDCAMDFFTYCFRNPRPCPLVHVSDAGDPIMRPLGHDIDIRTDIPQFNIYRDGRLIETVSDISDHWRDDLVSFALGCSFSFEDALLSRGFRLRHIERGRTVPMYRTNVQTRRAGAFWGPTVVSMRPFSPDDIDDVCEITGRYPYAHGEPIHIGNPERIGIENLEKPDWGDLPDVQDGELPAFWACGVTPQVALRNARPSLCITHAPGRMLICDLPNTGPDDNGSPVRDSSHGS